MPAQIGILFEFGECLNPLPDPPDIELAALTRRDPDHSAHGLRVAPKRGPHQGPVHRATGCQ